MYPPSQGFHLDIDSISGICGSISIACWLVVFTPQIFENFRRSSTDGLSVFFVAIWLTGDVCNVLGAVLQGVLPTMIILAVYYAFADILLLGQCFYYRGFVLSDTPSSKGVQEAASRDEEGANEDSPLLSEPPCTASPRASLTPASAERKSRRNSSSSNQSFFTSVDATRLSPVTPFVPLPQSPQSPAARKINQTSTLHSVLLNALALLVVCLTGILGWWLSTRAYRPVHHGPQHDPPVTPRKQETQDIPLDFWGQIFGYLCATLYLSSRIPQLLLNYRRKSTEGISILFFLFACVGNLTYVMSIFAYEPDCARMTGGAGTLYDSIGAHSGHCSEGEWKRDYGRWVLVNASWLIGSAGTLGLDLVIFSQFWLYRGREPGRVDEDTIEHDL